jgi:glycosyltransferase involved in cell wall biosynthesis
MGLFWRYPFQNLFGMRTKQMKLIVISHKETWHDPSTASGYVTNGGFPFQMKAISELFDQTVLLLPRRTTPSPSGLRPLTGHNLVIENLSEPTGTDMRRKLALLVWLPRYLPLIWRTIHQADAVHAPVPGDIGLIGILIALVLHKPLFVRHCGTWGRQVTLADRFLLWLLERVAGGQNVVLATGWNKTPPSKHNPNIAWIFSTTLYESEFASIPTTQVWKPSSTLHLVTVGRLSPEKNFQAIIQSLTIIRRNLTDVTLDIVGDGENRFFLERLASDLGVQEKVIFHGNVSHESVLRILSNSHLFVFPTIREGFPKAVLEAMACGLPVVATNVSAIPQLIQDCGVILNGTGADEVANGILAIINDPSQLIEMSNIARRRASSFTLENWRNIIGNRLKTAWGELQSNV